jgi:hypothetical protein
MKRLRIIHLLTIIAVAVVAIAISLPAHAKKDEGPKTTIAVGNVNTGSMGFSSLSPKELAELFRVRAKKMIEKKGHYNVILPEPKDEIAGKTSAPKAKTQKQPATAAEAMKYAREMQEQYQMMMAQSQGRRVYYPVNANALYDFRIATGSRHVTTGGVFSQVEGMTGAPVGDADFSSDSVNMTLTCLRRNPQTGSLMDEYKAKASSTRVARVGGVSYYTMEDTSDPDRAFDRMFKRAMGKCVKWIDKQMK